ncbi:hypothetical protein [Paenibacillus donghaensis]|uniref:Copper amine oxidase n=1 Tax=Paenibacillus donghaensis TaxID=414771 RepID=A0A2Z2KCB2_9BACL|nr:hypothetical protein [Paenibacillus donghaensis]ASA23227.1 hypothetical protein B9T62_21910 [Paenibacillus donghaensis]
MRILKKLTILTFCFLMIPGGTLLHAAAPKPDINVYLNNVLQKQSGFISEGEIYLSAGQMTEQLNALMAVEDSGATVRINKPNVNTVLLDDKGNIFGKAKSTVSQKFSVLAQVDNLKTEISDLRITITSPSDVTETIDNQPIKDQKDNFWFKSAEYSYTFEAKGAYPVRVYLKDTRSKKWSAVSEIQIFAF